MSVTSSERIGTPLKTIPDRNFGRWGAGLVVVGVAILAGYSVITNPRFRWDVVGDYFTAAQILAGMRNTLQLTVIAMAIGVALGVALAIMRQSGNPFVSGAAWLYVWFFRGTPLLVQLIFWYNISALYPTVFGLNTNDFISPLLAAILGLGLNEAAYMAEIVRGGILSVDHGQTEAAQALGMSRLKILRRIVLPQAMRVIVPPTGNEAISMLKTTSLVSVLAYTELLYATQLIYSRTFQTIPMLIVASIWYIIVTSVFTTGQYYLERYFGRGASYQPRQTPMQRFVRAFGAAR
ncbi:amino acid ABC transporter permease [Nonomuraea sp. NPDC026600]|uniref:amino acid ABC transporter permease n=1 Tax=Nonomuraea sp. NPDC026600 TaxID=3155363 RepID=UPI0033DE700B